MCIRDIKNKVLKYANQLNVNDKIIIRKHLNNVILGPHDSCL